MQDRPTDPRRGDDGLTDDDILTDEGAAALHSNEASGGPEDPDVDGITPLPEEITGRASGTDEDLVALFENPTGKHITDGFRGGSEDEPPVEDDAIDDDPTQFAR